MRGLPPRAARRQEEYEGAARRLRDARARGDSILATRRTFRCRARGRCFRVDDAIPAPRPEQPNMARAIEDEQEFHDPAPEIVGFDLLLNQFDRHADRRAVPAPASPRSAATCIRAGWWTRIRSSWTQLGHPYQGLDLPRVRARLGARLLGGVGVHVPRQRVVGDPGRPRRRRATRPVTSGIGGSFLGEALFRMSNLVLEHRRVAAVLARARRHRDLAAGGLRPPGFRRPLRERLPEPRPGLLHAAAGGVQRHRGRRSRRRVEHQARRTSSSPISSSTTACPASPITSTRGRSTTSASRPRVERERLREHDDTGPAVGRTYGADVSYRGIWGVYGNYDYIAPQTFRISTTGVSLGTTGEAHGTWHGVSGTALLGTGYAAAGTIRTTTPTTHYGVAPQALRHAALEIFRARAAIDVTARDCYVSRLAAAARGRARNIRRADARSPGASRGRTHSSIEHLGTGSTPTSPTSAAAPAHQPIGPSSTPTSHDRFGYTPWK